MNALLDTHTFYWWIVDDPCLSDTARDALVDPRNRIYFSVVVAWEIAIKARLGKMVLPGDVERDLPQRIQENGFIVLPVDLPHVLAV